MLKKKKGYGQIAATSFLNEKRGNSFGFNACGGASVGNLSSIGVGADFYLFEKSKSTTFAQLYGDFRFYFSGLDKQASHYIAFQPGAILYNKSINGVTTKGSFAVNGLASFFIRSKKGIGGTMAAGISHITFTTVNYRTNYTGGKITAGIFF